MTLRPPVTRLLPGHAGVDEAGRGPLAGPVVAAAVILPDGHGLAGLADSKRVAPAARVRLASAIRECAVAWAVAEASVEEIDHLNILQASLLAMRRAIEALSVRPSQAVVDGNQSPRIDLPVVTVVGGDASVPAISAASILAKVARDNLLVELDRAHPGYGFADHKGYPTPAHLAALRRLGPCTAHRRSFAPVRASRVSAGSQA